MHRKNVIALVGPTASGKSALGIRLAKKLGGEIISADSRQVYKGLDLGTGKVTKKEMRGVPHHLLNVASPKRRFTVDDFVRRADAVISRTELPLVVGGTGLYTDMLLGRMSYPNVPPNDALRAQLEKRSTAALFAMLKKKDPARAATIEPHHKRRIIRALEIARALGANPPPQPAPKYEVLWLGLSPDDTALRARINARLRTRLRAGMLAEGKRLHKQGLSYKRMEELGLEYRFLAAHMRGTLSREAFTEGLERAIWQYAKRQKKWFKRNSEIRWIKNETEALRLAKAFLSR